MKRAAVATLNAMWNRAVALARSGCHELQQVRDRLQERRHQQDAGQPVDEIAERQAIAGGIVAARALDDRIDRAAEIGAEHQRQRRVGRDEMRIGQRHHQQHAGDARMHQPGHQRPRR